MAQKKQNGKGNRPHYIKVRPARRSDATRIAELSGQLGYPAKPADIVRRLRKIKPASQHVVMVAQSPEEKVIGWIHASVSPLLEVDLRAEVNALVVADNERSRGGGRLAIETRRRVGKKARMPKYVCTVQRSSGARSPVLRT